MNSPPTVSVVTIFLNCSEYLTESIESVLAQTYPYWELLLVDDGSSDGSLEVASGYAAEHPDRLRVLRHPGGVNRGMSASRNLGIANATGEYLAFLDGDDVFLPRKLETQVAFLEKAPTTGMLYGPTEYWYSWTGTAEDAERDHIPTLGAGGGQRFERPALLVRNYPLGTAAAPCLCSLLVRTDAARRVGGFEESFKGFYEDQAFLAKIYLAENVAVIDECLDRYRIHDRSCSALTRASGKYDRYRSGFLKWLQNYLANRSADQHLMKKIDDALREIAPIGRRSEVQWLRLLRVAEGGVARVETGESTRSFRIVIDRVGTSTPWDVQVNLPRLRLFAEEKYSLSFLVRADSPRPLRFGCAEGRAPWLNLGCYDSLEVMTEWQHFVGSFTATADHDNARIHFDVGERAVSVEISGIALYRLSTGEEVIPDLPANRTDVIDVPPPVAVGAVDFGSLRRLVPISADFGCDRGRPVDRYYIERFLDDHAGDVRGSVLEIGESTYTRRFGGDRVTKVDVLHVTEGDPEATIIADLASAEHLPADSFDCIIITQTLQLIYDLQAAVGTIHRILKPGGVVLATLPGISQTYDNEWGGTWYWNFTPLSAQRIFSETFDGDNVTVRAAGNVLAAISFLHGVADGELTPEELDYADSDYPVSIGVRAVKQPSSDGGPNTRVGAVRGASDRGSLMILMYHRVAEPVDDPWSLCVSPEHFREQLEILSAGFELLTVAQVAEALANGSLPDVGIAITFDDGYSDNLLAARPLLDEFSCPATFYLTAGALSARREFWWDELQFMLLDARVVPGDLRLTIEGNQHVWSFGRDAVWTDQERQRYGSWNSSLPPPTRRHQAYLELWTLLQPLSSGLQEKILNDIRVGLGRLSSVRPAYRALSVADVAALTSSDLVEIGAHTVTHPILTSLPADLQRKELMEGKQILEAMVNGPVTTLSFPFGSHDDLTVQLAIEAGYLAACTTEQGIVRIDTSPFRLPRFQVGSWGGAKFRRILHDWAKVRTA